MMHLDPARLLYLRFFLPLLPEGLLEAAADPDAAACCFACSSRTFFAFSDLPGCLGQSSATFSNSAFPAHPKLTPSPCASHKASHDGHLYKYDQV